MSCAQARPTTKIFFLSQDGSSHSSAVTIPDFTADE
jgi:hypothetical protein